ncbi:sugar phosphate isomerase/epimerase family protein [Streptomyces sp. NPDC087856]|uniref:sugar phosphate isomerase/epimerase family protein n=1 Tax=Streptomyces sp. NPDC087856 TaxID=3365811 RepID=UPI00382F4982
MTARLPWALGYTVSGDDCATPMPLGYAAPLHEAVRQLAELGYDGVEVQVRKVGAQDAEKLAKTVGDAGLRVLGIGTGPVAAHDRLTLADPSPDVRRHALSRLCGAARLAGELGVPVTLGQTRGIFLPGHEAIQSTWVDSAVERLAEEASDHGSRLLLEPQSRANTSLWHTPEEALTVIGALGALGHPAGLVLDTYHLDAEGVEVIQALTQHASVTGCLQLAAPVTRGPLSLGDPRLRSVLKALSTGGFTGWLTLEHSQDGDSARAAARSWTALRDAADVLV